MSEHGCPPCSSSLKVDLPESQQKSTQSEVPDTDGDDFFSSIISSPSKRKENDDSTTQSQAAGCMNEDEAWQEKGHLSDSSSEERLPDDLQLARERDYLWDQLDFILEHLKSNMPKHLFGRKLAPPWAEEAPLCVVRDYVVAAIDQLFELGTAEGILEAQKGLVLQAKSLCQEQCCEI